MKDKAKRIKGILALLLLMILSANSHFLMSVATDDNLQKEIKAQAIVETEIEKFVGYNLGEKNGTLVQLGVQTGIEYENEDDRIPLGATGILLNAPQLDGKFPQSAELIVKSTKCTNGDEKGKKCSINYDKEKGQVKILTFNQADEEGQIYTQTSTDRDNYCIVLNYEGVTNQVTTEDTQIAPEEQIIFSGKVIELLADDAKTEIKKEFEQKIENRMQKSELISNAVKTTDVYNGYIKYNKQKQTDYETTYNELLNLNISKLVGEDETQLSANTVLKAGETEKTAEDVIYNSVIFNKQELLEILGENGKVSIQSLDGEELAVVNKDTEASENGIIKVAFEKEVSNIKIVLSKIEKLGYLRVQFIKTIKSTMQDTSVTNIQTAYEVKSVTRTEEKYQEDGEEKTRTVENEVYKNQTQNSIEIKDSKTTVEFNPSSVNWTNEKQNEVDLQINLKNNSGKYNLFKNPEFTLQLPEEVEKVILDKEVPMYANGLEVESVDYNKDTRVLTVKMTGEQTSYLPEDLTNGTHITIPAIIILKSEIESKDVNLQLNYKNTNVLTGEKEEGTATSKITLVNFTQELTQNDSQRSLLRSAVNPTTQEEPVAEQQDRATNDELTADGIRLSVKPIRGDVELSNGDTVYEGEFIKYEITATNTKDTAINNVKINVTLPDGVTYGELVREDNKAEVESYYDFTKQIQPIDLGTIEAGKSATTYFEVKVNDLADEEREKDITTNIKVYIGDKVSDDYSITHKVEHAEYKVFLSEKIFLTNQFKYILKVEGDTTENVDIKVNLPECMKAKEIASYNSTENYYQELNSLTELNLNLKPGQYLIYTEVDTTKIEKNNKDYSIEVKAVATVNNKYKSNENRILLQYYQLSITIDSENKGEKVKYGDEINYVINVTNNGRLNFTRDDKYYVYANIKDILPKVIEPIEIIYNNFEINKEYNEEDENSEFFIEEKNISKNISTKIGSEDGEEATIDINVLIPSDKSIQILVKTKAGRVFEQTNISNFTTVSEMTILGGSSNPVESRKSNTITHTILPNNYENPIPVEPVEPEVPVDPENPEEPTEPSDPEKPNNTENPTNPDDPENPEIENKYSLGGLVWLDENEDGIKQQSEKTLDGVKVYLAKTTGKISKITQTLNNGQYNFDEIAADEYIVVFQYDNNKYRITKYNASGNSKATAQEVNLKGEKIAAGVTDIIKISENKTDINLGLIENKKFDFKVENYISKVTVKTTKDTIEKTYDNISLAKTEIKAKDIEGATVEVEYKIIITNNGEQAGTVNKVIDVLPAGFIVESNGNWIKDSNGNLVNTSIANKQIQAGKSVELILKVNKMLSENTLGTYINEVMIEGVENSLGLEELNLQNNSSKCELILSVSTGVVINIIISAIIISIIIIILNIKFGIFNSAKIKIFSALLLVGLTIFMQANFIKSSALTQTEEYIQNHCLQKDFYLTAVHFGPKQRVKMGDNKYTLRYRWEDIYKNSPHYCKIINIDDPINSPERNLNSSWRVKFFDIIGGSYKQIFIYDDEENEIDDINCSSWSNDAWNYLKGTVNSDNNWFFNVDKGIISDNPDAVYFERDWRVFLDTEHYPLVNVGGKNYIINGNVPQNAGEISGICVDYDANANEPNTCINITNLGIDNKLLVEAGEYGANVNAYLPRTYTWGRYNASSNTWIYDFDGSYTFKDNETEVDYQLKGNTNDVVNIKATEDSYILGPLKITDNTIKYSDKASNNNDEYTFSITPIDGNTIWTDYITACKDVNGTIEYSKETVQYYDNGVQNITHINKNTNFYLKVNKSLIDQHGGVGYITCYSKKDYIDNRNVYISGMGVWNSGGYQRVTSPVNISYVDSYNKTAGKEINWNLSEAGICVRKIDEFNGASDNATNNKLGGIQLKILDVTKNGYLKCDNLGNLQYYEGDINEATTLVTANDGNAYIKDTSIRYIVGLEPSHEYRVYETFIPEELEDYYKRNNKALNLIWNDNEYGSITVTEGFFFGYTAINHRDFTSLQLHKRDEEGHNLTGITFRIQDVTKDDISGRREKYVYFYKSTYNYAGYNPINGSYSIANGLIAPETLNNGFPSSSPYTAEIVIGNNGLSPLLRKLPLGRKYRIVETNFGIYDNIYKTKIVKEINTKAEADGIKLNQNNEIIINYQEYGALTIAKREKATKAPLKGFGFKIWCQKSATEYGWLILEEDNGVFKPVSYSGKYNGDGNSNHVSTIYTDKKDLKTGVYKTLDIIKLDMKYKYYVFEVFIPDEYRLYFSLDSTGNSQIYDLRTVAEEQNVKTVLSAAKKYCVTPSGVVLKKGIKEVNPYNESVVTYATNLSDNELEEMAEENKYIANKQTYISISGYAWEEALTGKNIQEKGNTYSSEDDYKLNGVKVSLIDKNGNVVKYRKQDGSIVEQSKKTGIRSLSANKLDSGVYNFDYVIIDKLNDYRIRFTYDGYTYENVLPFAKVNENGKIISDEAEKIPGAYNSSVSEDYYQLNRATLNKYWKEITGGQQSIGNGTTLVELEYQNEYKGGGLKEGNVVCKVNNLSNVQLISKAKGIVENDDTSYGKFLINADTYGKDKNGNIGELMKYYLNFANEYKNSKTLLKEIPNINLGLYRREMPNLELHEDIYKADVTVNGKSYTYMYDFKLKEVNEGEGSGIQVDFEGDYSLPIYEADANYKDSEGKGIEATITYKIALENLTNNLYTEIKGINEYYTNISDKLGLQIDSDEPGKYALYLSDNAALTEFNDDNRVQIKSGSKIKGLDGLGGYKIEFANPIQLSKMIHGQNETSIKYLYIRFKIIDPKRCYYLLTGKEDWQNYAQYLSKAITSFESHTEIGTYSVYSSNAYDENSRYAGVDYTSRPTNYNPLDVEHTDEDDSDKAPGLKIVAVNPRSIDGIVFEDTPVYKFTGKDGVERTLVSEADIKQGEERLGNGYYDESSNNNNINKEADKPISNVKVRLIDVTTGNKAQRWDGVKWVDAEYTTGVDGTYSMTGFVPGNYKIEFEWGQDYGGKDVREYKSTVYTNGKYNADASGIIANNSLWIYDTDDENYKRYSDAVDDYNRRLAIDKRALGLEDDIYTEESERIAINRFISENLLETMVSSTPDFDIEVEKDTDGICGPDENERLKNTEKGLNELFEHGYEVKDIDFGIIERAKQAMGLGKHIKSLSIRTSDGRPVIIATIGVDGKVTAISGESYISGGFNLGYLYAQIDKNLQGDMEVKIEYDITVTSYSEKDYDAPEYYYLGTPIDGKDIKLDNKYLYDYLDGSSINSEDENWKTADMSDIYLKTANNSSDMIPTVVEDEFKRMKEEIKDLSEENIKQYIENEFEFDKYPSSKDNYKELFIKWATGATDTNNNNIRRYKLNNKTILAATENNILTNKSYEAGEAPRTQSMTVSKILANGDDIQFNNEVEIATVSVEKGIKTARRANTRIAPLYAKSEYITISPATGENRDYFGLTIAIIGILTVFASGIILIKRFIKK